MKPILNSAAADQQCERDHKRDQDNSPLPDAAGDTNARREPRTGGAGEPANPGGVLRANNDPCAKKTDAGEDTLHDAAGSVGNFCRIGGWLNQYHGQCRGKTHQAKRLQADRLAMKIAVKTDQAAGERGNAKAQQNLGPVQQCDDLSRSGRQR